MLLIDTPLKQQRLPAWQPILTACTVLPLFFVIGVVFVILGSIILDYSNNINEFTLDYTYCQSNANPADKCNELIKTSHTVNCTCTLNFTLGSAYTKPVYIYYGLKNFYQNHRRYVKSRDDNQLLGRQVTNATVNTDCDPYTSKGNFLYAPCGAIANSLFNDSFQITYVETQQTVPLLRTGIAWTTDKNVKFGTVTNWNDTIRPVNWQINVQDLDPLDTSNTGYKNEDLIVWMRTAALPNFRKFYRRVDHTQSNFTDGLPKGYYKVDIKYSK